MTIYTHAELTAAIDKARDNADLAPPQYAVGESFAWANANTAHLDTLAAILDLHKPYESVTGARCTACAGGTHREPWPCPTVRVVVDALTRMGAL